MNRFILAAAASILLTGSAATAEVTEADLADDQTITTQVVTNGMGPPPAAVQPAGHAEQGQRQVPAGGLGLQLWW